VQKRPYRYGGLDFATLGKLKAHISEVIAHATRPVGQVFACEVLSEVVVDRHYRWRHRGVRPDLFQFMRNEAGDGRHWDRSLSGHFGPDWGWCRFSYVKCMRATPYTMKDHFKKLCLERWSAVWRQLGQIVA